MKLVTYSVSGKEQVGFYRAEDDCVVAASEVGLTSGDMNSLIRELDEKKFVFSDKALEGKSGISLSDVTLEAPIPCPERDVICLGLNYREHAAEAAEADDAYEMELSKAVYFSKRVDRAVAPGAPINGHFGFCTQLDYEVELAVVIGKDAKNVKREDAEEYILGYTILNDVSARNLQASHQQWYLGKSLDGFTPIGPWIVTRDEIGPQPDLGIRCYVNDEERQNSRTSMLIFSIPYIIEELSSGITLHAGTIISTGTPSGVALGMKDPKYLNKGDVVRCEIDKIGELVNPVG